MSSRGLVNSNQRSYSDSISVSPFPSLQNLGLRTPFVPSNITLSALAARLSSYQSMAAEVEVVGVEAAFLVMTELTVRFLGATFVIFGRYRQRKVIAFLQRANVCI